MGIENPRQRRQRILTARGDNPFASNYQPPTPPRSKFRVGDWVMQREVRMPVFGTVFETWDDGTMDVVVYAAHGEKIGRHSPPEGGPTKYEPSVPQANYEKIKKPTFPLKVVNGCWRSSLVLALDKKLA